jgi:hypothetical protein
MPFEWKEFVDVARFLLLEAGKTGNQEGMIRSAVSRAYFAAFCHAWNYANQFLQFEPREDVDDHGRLRRHLKDRRRKGDADRLEQLRQWRNEADYLNELPWVDFAATAAQALSHADRVFASLIPPTKTI